MRIFKHLLLLFISFFSATAFADPTIINGLPAGDLFPSVGTFNNRCTVTKVGPKQFITAAHCVGRGLSKFHYDFGWESGTQNVALLSIHPSWLKDCENFPCTGKEVGGPNMTPGRADVAFIQTEEDVPGIPNLPILFAPVPVGTEVAMVGAGCTGGVSRGGPDGMRYAITRTLSAEALIHPHSLYRKIARITGLADWITPGYDADPNEASLCPGDSGGPLLTRNANGRWMIIGIAADYTFNGPYQDGAPTITNLHTRLDDESYHEIGKWLRSLGAKGILGKPRPRHSRRIYR